MPHHRFFTTDILEQGQLVTLRDEESHHLRVLRSKPGDCVELVNGGGVLAQARLCSLDKASAQLEVIALTAKQEFPSKRQLILAQALPRMNHLDWIIEKGTELGATAFWLFPGLLSEKATLSDNQEARLRALAIAAMKQCGRLDLPEIVVKPPLLKWQACDGSFFFGDTVEGAPYLADHSPASPLPSPIVVFIGPEKGFTEKERHYLLHSLHAKGIRLHPNILRAETAPLVALVQLCRFV
jgi:16S rRNA (uracil1498-N3)-methyltransferase